MLIFSKEEILEKFEKEIETRKEIVGTPAVFNLSTIFSC
jgi:hypothetical protein